MMEESYYNSFKARLERSTEAVHIVSKWLNEKQRIPCVINPAICFKRGDDPNLYKDNGDMYMQMRTEVKHNPNSYWTGRSNYPTDNIIICNAKVYDELIFKPKYYYIVNGPMTHAAIVDVYRTKDNWVRESTTDSYRGHTYDTYQIPKDIPPIVKLRDVPRGTLVI